MAVDTRVLADVDVLAALVAVERLLAAHREELDAINVFPVPDADTGQNVLATVRAAREGAEQAQEGERGPAAVEAAVRGARGNSGVLVSQVLRGLLGAAAAGDDRWDRRLRTADELARAAVATPVEGSLLTAVTAAADAAAAQDAPARQLAAAVEAAHVAVAESPTRMEVLARAGVVDAGARAAALLLDAFVAAVTGGSPAPPEVSVPAGGVRVAGCESGVDGSGTGRYEVMYLLEPGTDDVSAALRDGLAEVGESVAVVSADRLVSVHVHTDDIGAVLEVGLAHGRPHRIRVEDTFEEARAAAATSGRPAADVASEAPAGVVVVVDGPGLATLARGAGATVVPHDDAGLPSIDELERAVDGTGRARVIVLPGHVDVARRATQLAAGDGVTVAVVRSATDPARLLAVLAVLDPTSADAAELEEIAAAVRSGRLTARAGGGWTASVGTAEVVRSETLGAALDGLADALGASSTPDTPELVTLLVGAAATAPQRDEAVAWIGQRWPTAELEVVDAGQRASAFCLGLE